MSPTRPAVRVEVEVVAVAGRAGALNWHATARATVGATPASLGFSVAATADAPTDPRVAVGRVLAVLAAHLQVPPFEEG